MKNASLLLRSLVLICIFLIGAWSLPLRAQWVQPVSKSEIALVFNTGWTEWNDFTAAFGLYYFRNVLANSGWAVGPGIGLQSQNIELGETYLPLLARINWEHPGTKNGLNAGLSTGYAFGLRGFSPDVDRLQGGWIFFPRIGYLVGNPENFRVNLGIGYQVQWARHERDTPWLEHPAIREYRYQRITLNLGLAF